MTYTDRANYWASKFGVDPRLYQSLVRKESGFNPGAVNPSSGAFGLTQAMPATASDPGFGVAPLDRGAGAEDQLRFGAEYLDAMLDRYGGDKEKALAAYNWGPGNADKWSGDRSTLPAETRDYISSILGDTTPETPTEPPTEKSTPDTMLGRLAERTDEKREALRKKLGADRLEALLGIDRSAPAANGGMSVVGNMLGALGQQLMNG